MKILDITELMETYTKQTSKFCMYMSFSDGASADEIMKTAPFFECGKLEDLIVCSTDQQLILTFDTEEEMDKYFDQIKDNGIVFAVTCGNGELLDEI